METSDGTVTIVHSLPAALVHAYPLPKLAAEAIPLYRGDFEVDGKTHHGIVYVELQPRPRLRVHGNSAMVDAATATHGRRVGREPVRWVSPATVLIPGRQVPEPAKTVRQSRKSFPPMTVRSFVPEPAPIEVGDTADVEGVTFFLLNGWTAEDGLNTCYGGCEGQGRLEVTLGDWQLRIEPRGDVPVRAIRDVLRTGGPSTVTHVGRLRRDDGAPFDASDVTPVLELVETTLSFALGRLTAIILPVGWRSGRAAWARWACHQTVDPPSNSSPFLDRAVTIAQLVDLLQAAFLTSADKLRWGVFQNALGYLMSAHDATVEMKIMLPVSALQLLSYAHLVEELPVMDPRHLSNSNWRKLSAEEALRQLLGSTGIDLNVPAHMTHLADLHRTLSADLAHEIATKRSGLFDALSCAVYLRNQVAHPKERNFGRWPLLEWAEASFFVRDVFTLAMLWWLRYDGRYLGASAEYQNGGDSIHVPWH